MSELKFPENFLWGSATSAYQVEGEIDNCDWARKFPAGKACDHYHKFEEDFDLLEELNQNAYRFSIEWSRVEPEPGEFDREEIEHYRKVLRDLKARGITTMVTLHHFTNPRWVAEKGSWTNSKIAFYFNRFAQEVFEEYQDLVDYWITINEPVLYSRHAYFLGEWPPRKRNIFLALKVIRNELRAHKKVYQGFHRKNSGVEVGIAKNNVYFEPAQNWLDGLEAEAKKYLWNEWFLNRIDDQLDFIGLNYYHHNKVEFPYRGENENEVTSDLGWEICPEGIYHVLKELNKYGKPILITENGVADSEDRLRKDFIKNHLRRTHEAIEEGVDVQGYFYWSLMDNFEWADGYEPRFGLIKIDYDTLERKIRPSALYYAQIAETNKLKP